MGCGTEAFWGSNLTHVVQEDPVIKVGALALSFVILKLVPVPVIAEVAAAEPAEPAVTVKVFVLTPAVIGSNRTQVVQEEPWRKVGALMPSFVVLKVSPN